MMVDLATGQTLYARETGRRFVPASVVKVMTAYTAFRLIEEGAIAEGTPVLITPELEAQWYGEGSTMFLRAGEQPSFGQLLLGATTVSGNDASVALAEAATGSVAVWVALMNRNAAELGMRDTHFGSANGYPDEGRTFTTARDLALLGQAVVERYPEHYARYFGNRTLTWRGLTQYNHDPVTGRVAGADGMKTGYTNEAGFNFLGSGEREGRRLVFVLAGAPTEQARDTTARAFLRWGFADFELHPVIPEGTIVGHALVQDGAEGQVALRPARAVSLSLPVDDEQGFAMAIRYHGPLQAPVAEGTEVASLRVTIEGQPPLDLPLLAAGSVAKANFLQRVRNGLEGLFG